MRAILCLLAGAVLSSCQSAPPVPAKPIAPSVILAATQAVSTSTSPEDQAKKSAVFQKIADSLTALPPTALPDQVRQAIVDAAPESPHWFVLATVISSYYQQYADSVAASKRSDTTNVVLGEIAKGLVQVAATSLSASMSH